METDNKKIKRYSFWAVFIISIGMIASYILPEESVSHFFELLKDVIGSRIATFPSSWKWEGGIVPVLSTSPNSEDLLIITRINFENFVELKKDFK